MFRGHGSFHVGEEIMLAVVCGGGSHHLTEGAGKVLAVAEVEFLCNLDDGHSCRVSSRHALLILRRM